MSRKWVRWTVIILGGLVLVLVVAVAGLYGIGTARANQAYEVSVAVPPIPGDAAAIQRGEHIATTIGLCKRCHGENLGGKVDFAVPGLVTIPTPNLTSGAGGIGSQYTDEDWVRAIRHGVGRDGRALMLMTSSAFYYLGEEDLGALIAYVKSVPPVDNVLPERRIDLLGRLMMAVGMFPPAAAEQIDHTTPPPAAPEAGVTADYGQYLTRTCTECHGANLNGAPFGPPGEEVPSPNLTPGGELASWSEEDFIKTLRSGVTPSGHQLITDMPWMYYGQMTDEELQAMWLYLQSLPALEQGG